MVSIDEIVEEIIQEMNEEFGSDWPIGYLINSKEDCNCNEFKMAFGCKICPFDEDWDEIVEKVAKS
ncbi:MAG: hypothetical protein ACFFCW_13630 [Candidatus Hodarchaeota archaeon]